MSIKPQFADAILNGTKTVEFRKRRLAPDVTTVLIYATMPIGQVVGAFEIAGYDVASPTRLWERHKKHAGIARAPYRDYYRGTRQAVGLLVADARRLTRPVYLRDLDVALRPPQSFCYLQLAPWEPAASVAGRVRNELALTSGQ